MHLILTGSTGLVGSAVLDAVLKMKDISKISILSRRAVKMAEEAKDPRVTVIIHNDFTKYDAAVLKQLEGADGCVWALGIAQEQVSRESVVIVHTSFLLSFYVHQLLPSYRVPYIMCSELTDRLTDIMQ